MTDEENNAWPNEAAEGRNIVAVEQTTNNETAADQRKKEIAGRVPHFRIWYCREAEVVWHGEDTGDR